MSSKSTDHLNLHAWDRTDAFSMDEFNENFDAIDKAIAAKAEQTALAAETAARKSALDTLTKQVAAKAEQSALDTLAGKVDKKAEQTALAAETAARNAAVTTLNGQVAAAARGNCRIITGTYTGNGKYGPDHKNSITFPETPLLVMVIGGNGVLFTAPTSTALSPQLSTGAAGGVYTTWSGNTLTWYNYYYAEIQLNESGQKYRYIALLQA